MFNYFAVSDNLEQFWFFFNFWPIFFLLILISIYFPEINILHRKIQISTEEYLFCTKKTLQLFTKVWHLPLASLHQFFFNDEYHGILFDCFPKSIFNCNLATTVGDLVVHGIIFVSLFALSNKSWIALFISGVWFTIEAVDSWLDTEAFERRIDPAEAAVEGDRAWTAELMFEKQAVAALEGILIFNWQAEADGGVIEV